MDRFGLLGTLGQALLPVGVLRVERPHQIAPVGRLLDQLIGPSNRPDQLPTEIPQQLLTRRHPSPSAAIRASRTLTLLIYTDVCRVNSVVTNVSELISPSFG